MSNPTGHKRAELWCAIAATAICLMCPLVGTAQDTLSTQKPSTGKNSLSDVFDQYLVPPNTGLRLQDLARFLLANDQLFTRFMSGQPEVVRRQCAMAKAAEMFEGHNMDSTVPGVKVMSYESFKNVIGADKLLAAGLSNRGIKEIGPAKPPDYLAKVNKNLSTSRLHLAYGTGVSGLEDQGARPAQFSWTHQKGSLSTYGIDAALSYKQDLATSQSLVLVPAIEAHLSNAKSNVENNITAQAPLILNSQIPEGPIGSPWLYGNAFSVGPSFQTDRLHHFEIFEGDFLYTPLLNDLPYLDRIIHITTGAVVPIGNRVGKEHTVLAPWLSVILLPSFGFQGGEALKYSRSSVYTQDPDYIRFIAKLHADIWSTEWLHFGIDYTHINFLNGSGRPFDFVSFSPVVYPAALFVTDENLSLKDLQTFSFGLTFKFGKSAPQFQETQSISAWLGVKF